MFREGSIAARRAAASAGATGSGLADRSSGLLDGGAGRATGSSNGSIGSDLTDIVLSTDGGVGARLATINVIRLWRELAGVNRVERVGQSLLGLGEYLVAIRGGRKQRNDAPWSLEREIGRLPERPVAAAMRGQLLLRADAVDRQLQRPRSIRRPAELVVDEPERSVLEQVDTVGLAAQGHRARSVRGGHRESSVEPALEQPFDDRDRPLGFHAEHCLAQPGGC